MINELIKLSNHLDNGGFHDDADRLDGIMKQGSEASGDATALLDLTLDMENLTPEDVSDLGDILMSDGPLGEAVVTTGSTAAVNDLIKLSTHLDAAGLSKEADYLDALIKIATNPAHPPNYMLQYNPENKDKAFSIDEINKLQEHMEKDGSQIEEIQEKLNSIENDDEWALGVLSGESSEDLAHHPEGFGLPREFMQELEKLSERERAELGDLLMSGGTVDGSSVTTSSSHLLNDLIKLSTHLDEKGFSREANYLDAIIKKTADDHKEGADDDDTEDDGGDEPHEERKPSKYLKMKISKIIEEMCTNDIKSLSLNVAGHNVRFSKVESD
jgi:hypothetical protein